MNLYIGITDVEWFNFQRANQLEDINFWQPGGTIRFRALRQGEPFLFKLKSPINAIVGVGFFCTHSFLPMSLVWETFKEGNGCPTYSVFRDKIMSYRFDKNNFDPTIGCVVLNQPIFFSEEDWIDQPKDWSKSIVQGKSYSTKNETGNELWTKINDLIEKYSVLHVANSEITVSGETTLENYKMGTTKIRIGQSAFRILVTDAYSRKCCVTGEVYLPALEAAHIRSFAHNGPHSVRNGVLLRADLHRLFDIGYLTITPELKVEFSSQLFTRYGESEGYIKYHGDFLENIPISLDQRPSREFLNWHNSNVFKG